MGDIYNTSDLLQIIRNFGTDDPSVYNKPIWVCPNCGRPFPGSVAYSITFCPWCQTFVRDNKEVKS